MLFSFLFSGHPTLKREGEIRMECVLWKLNSDLHIMIYGAPLLCLDWTVCVGSPDTNKHISSTDRLCQRALNIVQGPTPALTSVQPNRDFPGLQFIHPLQNWSSIQTMLTYGFGLSRTFFHVNMQGIGLQGCKTIFKKPFPCQFSFLCYLWSKPFSLDLSGGETEPEAFSVGCFFHKRPSLHPVPKISCCVLPKDFGVANNEPLDFQRTPELFTALQQWNPLFQKISEET